MIRVNKKIAPEILRCIEEKEAQRINTVNTTRFYSYYERHDGKVAIATVAVKSGKNYKGKKAPATYIKKVCVHPVGSMACFCRDIYFVQMGGYIAKFEKEKELDNKSKEKIVGHYIEDEWWGCDNKYFRLYNHSDILNPEFLKETEEFRYCAWDKKTDILDYLNAYTAQPKIESITKIVGSKFATSNKFVSKIDSDKEFLRWVLLNKEALKRDGSVAVALMAYRLKYSIEKARVKYSSGFYFAKRKISPYGYSSDSYTPLQKIYHDGDKKLQDKIKAYLIRNVINPEHFNDYIIALQYLNLDVNDTKNLFPKNFEYWCKVRLDQYASEKAKKDAKKHKEITRKIKKVAKKYSSLTLMGDDYVVLIADDKQSLIYEGERLKHCVGGMNYDQRIAREESLIFFIRKALNTAEPYVTVEFSIKEKKVLQCYGANDKRPDDETMTFVNAWEQKARRKVEKIIKNNFNAVA